MPRMVLSLLIGLAGLSPAWSQEPGVWVASPWQHVLRSTEPGGAKSAEIVADLAERLALTNDCPHSNRPWGNGDERSREI